MRAQLKSLAVLLAAFAIALAAALPARGDSESSRLAELHDNARSEHNLGSLARAQDLAADAAGHARQMAARGEIYHSGRTSRLDGWDALGENVGWAGTVEEVFDLFMESSSHRENILYSTWDSIGVGIAPGEGGELYVAVLFGDRADAPAAKAAARKQAVKKPRAKAPERKRVPAPVVPTPSVRATPIVTASPVAPQAPAPSVPPLPADPPQPTDASRALGVLLSVEREHREPLPTEASAIGDVSAETARRMFSESEAERRRQAEQSPEGKAARSLGGVARCAWSC